MLLEHVERIDVISGTGGTLWGTNAVNGVIITASAKDTAGVLVAAAGAAGGGDAEAATEVRYGGAIGSDGNYPHTVSMSAVITPRAPTAVRSTAVDPLRTWDLVLSATARAGTHDAYAGDENQRAPGMFTIIRQRGTSSFPRTNVVASPGQNREATR